MEEDGSPRKDYQHEILFFSHGSGFPAWSERTVVFWSVWMPQLLGLSWRWRCSDVAERAGEWIIRGCSRVAGPQRSAQPLLCVALMAQPLFLASAPRHPPRCWQSAACVATAGDLEMGSVRVLTWQLEVGEEFQPWEKVEEAAVEPAGAAGSAGSVRSPGRGLWLCLLRGELGRKGTLGSPDPLCTEISLIPCAKVSCLVALWFYFFFPLLLRKMKMLYWHSSPKPKTFLAARFRN